MDFVGALLLVLCHRALFDPWHENPCARTNTCTIRRHNRRHSVMMDRAELTRIYMKPTPKIDDGATTHRLAGPAAEGRAAERQEDGRHLLALPRVRLLGILHVYVYACAWSCRASALDGWRALRAAITRLSHIHPHTNSYMRRLHHCCRLVHGDLSEYNMLYHQGQLFIIDVSQVGLWA